MNVPWLFPENFRLFVCAVAWLGLACTSADPPSMGAQGGNAGASGQAVASAPAAGASSSGGTVQGGAGVTSAGQGGVAGAAPGGSGGVVTAGTAGLAGESDTFFGASRCSNAGLLLCDGFEGPTIDPDHWAVQKTSDNVVELSTAQAARGTKSLRIVAANGFGFVRNETIFPVPSNDYYGRMFVRVTRFSTVPWAHWTLAEAEGTGNGHRIRVGGQYRTDQGENRWGVGSDGGPTGDWTLHDDDPGGSPVEPPENAWVCLEWLHQGSADVTRFFVDGEEHPSLATTAQDHGGNQGDYVLPQFTSVWVGWWQYQEDPVPFELWIDEVAFDDERIGCFK